jgi:hypothetical protein
MKALNTAMAVIIFVCFALAGNPACSNGNSSNIGKISGNSGITVSQQNERNINELLVAGVCMAVVSFALGYWVGRESKR